MKVRTRFVSNSSSSSFCIYGAALDKETLKEILQSKEKIETEKEKLVKKAQEAYGKVPPEEYLKLKADAEHYEDFGEGFYEQFNKLITKFGLSYYDQSGDGEYFCIGRNFTSMKDDETKKQFQDSVQSKLAEMCGKKIECEVIEGEYAT